MLTSFAALKQKRPDLYWIFTLQSSQQELSMIIHLLALDSGMISKGKQVMWNYQSKTVCSHYFGAILDQLV